MDRIIYNLVEFWNKLSVSEIISYTIALGSLIITLVAYLRSKRTQKPKYFISSASLKNEEFKDTTFSIKQGDRSLSTLTISRFALWNTDLTLNRSDIAEKDPIRIEVVGDSEILEVQTLYSEHQNGFECKVSEDNKVLDIDFDFFAKNQGVVLKIFHTGKNSLDLAVKGSLKNGLCIKKSQITLNHFIPLRLIRHHISMSTIKKIYGMVFILTGPITIIQAVFRYSQGSSTHVYGLTETILSIIFGLFVALFGYFMYRRVMPTRLEKAFISEK